jgi:hypothetical protein
MAELASLIANYGLPTTVAAAVLYIVLRSEFNFRYPRSGKKP